MVLAHHASSLATHFDSVFSDSLRSPLHKTLTHNEHASSSPYVGDYRSADAFLESLEEV